MGEKNEVKEEIKKQETDLKRQNNTASGVKDEIKSAEAILKETKQQLEEVTIQKLGSEMKLKEEQLNRTKETQKEVSKRLEEVKPITSDEEVKKVEKFVASFVSK